jgi:hypothetical protein
VGDLARKRRLGRRGVCSRRRGEARNTRARGFAVLARAGSDAVRVGVARIPHTPTRRTRAEETARGFVLSARAGAEHSRARGFAVLARAGGDTGRVGVARIPHTPTRRTRAEETARGAPHPRPRSAPAAAPAFCPLPLPLPLTAPHTPTRRTRRGMDGAGVTLGRAQPGCRASTALRAPPRAAKRARRVLRDGCDGGAGLSRAAFAEGDRRRRGGEKLADGQEGRLFDAIRARRERACISRVAWGTRAPLLGASVRRATGRLRAP